MRRQRIGLIDAEYAAVCDVREAHRLVDATYGSAEEGGKRLTLA